MAKDPSRSRASMRSGGRTAAWLLGLTLLAAGCPSAPGESVPPKAPDTSRAPSEAGEVAGCPEPRPEVCIQIYDPVCAQRDNGVRCVTTPCDSTDPREYPNGCEACRDPLVVSYVPGRCP